MNKPSIILSFAAAICLTATTVQAQQVSTSEVSVPVLGDLPAIGRLFRSTETIPAEASNTDVPILGELPELGRLFQREGKPEASSTVHRVPFLGDLPAIGRLFRAGGHETGN